MASNGLPLNFCNLTKHFLFSTMFKKNWPFDKMLTDCQIYFTQINQIAKLQTFYFIVFQKYILEVTFL